MLGLVLCVLGWAVGSEFGHSFLFQVLGLAVWCFLVFGCCSVWLLALAFGISKCGHMSAGVVMVMQLDRAPRTPPQQFVKIRHLADPPLQIEATCLDGNRSCRSLAPLRFVTSISAESSALFSQGAGKRQALLRLSCTNEIPIVRSYYLVKAQSREAWDNQR